jgi:uncharacterized membrane protein
MEYLNFGVGFLCGIIISSTAALITTVLLLNKNRKETEDYVKWVIKKTKERK